MITNQKEDHGRPRKNPSEDETDMHELNSVSQEEVIMPGLDDINPIEDVMPGLESINFNDAIMPGLEEDTSTVLPGFESTTDYINNTVQNTEVQNTNIRPDNIEMGISQNVDTSTNYGALETNNIVIAKDKKLVSFIGTSKNGTTFLTINLGTLLSSMGIRTAVLDLTKNKNLYYITTNNDMNLIKTAVDSFDNLQRGIAKGVEVDNNLTVYTTLPTYDQKTMNNEIMINTLMNNYDVVLIDTDFNTPETYFKNSQEIYLVQSLDVLTIQPLTSFLRDLKLNNILDSEKLRVIINQDLRVKSLDHKLLLSGLSTYNDPSMSVMTDLFNKDSIKYTVVSFENENYAAYLDILVECNPNLKGYTKKFLSELRALANMVYPLIGGGSTFNKKQNFNNYSKNTEPPVANQGTFSGATNDTLEQMKKSF